MNDILSKMYAAEMLDQQALDRVKALRGEGKPLDEALVTGSGLSEEKVLRFLAQEFGLPYIDLDKHTPAKDFVSQFPPRILLEHRLLPVEPQNGAVLVATGRLFDTSGLDELRLASGREFKIGLAPLSEIERSIKQCLGVGADTMQSLVSDANSEGILVVDHTTDEDVDLSGAAEDASIITFVNQLLAEAIELRATDVHVEPFEHSLRVRYRVDGVMQEASIPPEVKRFQAAIVSRLKILSHLDIAEKRVPQDGRIKLKISGREIDVRVSVIPMLHGEAVVLRLLDRSKTLLGLEHLGMAARERDIFERVLALPHGIVLVTGPTGSGKTTTLYAALSRINDIERKIITIEDPIEYHLAGINQIQVAIKAGLTFGLGLRAILRHDPDVILIGEIRDFETAELAVQASLTGHLTFSTLHTNDAPSAPTRLVDMGIEPYLVASTLEMVVAQRLVRLICRECKTQYKPTDMTALQRALGDSAPEMLYRGSGCRACQGGGYHGRAGIFEMMPISEAIQALIMERVSSNIIRRQAAEEGMRNLRTDGWRLVLEGRTTIEEVLQATKEDQFTSGSAVIESPAADASVPVSQAKADE
jgi:general secretion pathway protein E